MAHCDALPEDLLPGMVEAQRLRDAWLARAAIARSTPRQADRSSSSPATGTRGATGACPRFLPRAAPELRVLSVGQFEVEAEDAPPFDLWLVTDAAERHDPCAAFRQ